MKKLMLCLGCSLLVLVLQSAQAQTKTAATTANSLKELFWLKGTWKGMANNSPFFEGFTIENDSLITIHYYADSSLSKVVALGKVLEEKGNIYHTYGKSKWKLVAKEGNTWSFAPVENASNHFQWTSTGTDVWQAVLITAGKKNLYRMERVKVTR